MFESTGSHRASTQPRRRARPPAWPGGPADQPWGQLPPTGHLFDLVAGLVPGALGDDQAIEAVVALGRLVAAAQATQLRMAAQFAELRPAEPASGRTYSEFAADELAPALRISRNAAASLLALATQLTSSLPGTMAALRRGEIDLPRARALCDVTAGVSATHAGAVEAKVLGRAPSQTAPQLRQSARRAVLSVDPDGATRRHREARALSKIQVLPGEDGMAELRAYLPAVQATAIYQRLCVFARRPGEQGDTRSADRRRVDAFTSLLLGSEPGGQSRVATQVQVTVAASTLCGADQKPGELAGYGPIPASLARELATGDDVTWRRIVTDPVSGTLLDYGRTTYRPPAALADHVRARDVTCRFPGCRHPARICDLDHSVPFPAGPTAAGNLGTLCRHHLRLKHEARWSVTQDDGDTFSWTSPTGRRYETEAEPHDAPAVAASTEGTQLDITQGSRARRQMSAASVTADLGSTSDSGMSAKAARNAEKSDAD